MRKTLLVLALLSGKGLWAQDVDHSTVCDPIADDDNKKFCVDTVQNLDKSISTLNATLATNAAPCNNTTYLYQLNQLQVINTGLNNQIFGYRQTATNNPNTITQLQQRIQQLELQIAELKKGRPAPLPAVVK